MPSLAFEQERDNMLQRQAEGIAAAKERGVKFGRKCIAVPDDFAELYLRWRGGEFIAIHFAKRCGLSRSTLFLRIKEFEETLSSTPDGSQKTTGININE